MSTNTNVLNCYFVNKRAVAKLTTKPLSNRLVPNETAVSVVQVTFRESLIDCTQVQVDSIMQVERHCPISLQHLQTNNLLGIYA